MPKNFKKLLVCIVATFSITAMVFSCCKKIGLCASSDSSPIEFSPPPLLFGEGIGAYDYVDHSIVLQCLDYAITHTPAHSDDAWIVMPSLSGNRITDINVMCPSISPSISDFGSRFTISYSISYQFDLLGNYRNSVNNASFGCYTDTVYETINGFTIYKSGFVYYPLYVYKPELYLSSNGVQVFSETEIPIGPSGHTKGGVLSNYIDSDDLIENSSDLPKVDNSAPSNSSSVPDWLQKILNGIGKLNQSIQGGVLTLGDYIGSMTEKIGEWFQDFKDSVGGFFDRVQDSLDDIIDTIEGLKDGSTVAQAQAAWVDEFENSVFQDFVDLKGSIEDDILTPIRNANAPSTLSFTIPLIKVNVPSLVNNGGSVSTATNNVYLFGQSVTLDFSWYTRSISGGVFNGSSIRDYLVPIIATFLYVGMVVHLLFKIPSFLSGSSGFSDTLHTVVVSFNGSKFKKA